MHVTINFSYFTYNADMKFFLIVIVFCARGLFADITFEVLGSGGPEIGTRAGTGYLLHIDGKARLLIDTGSGVMLRFGQSGAKIESLDAIAFTHLHIDHCVDFPAFVKAGYFSQRSAPLPVIGPAGNDTFPSVIDFVQGLFGPRGIYRYMQDVLTPRSDSFELLPQIAASKMVFEHFTLAALPVHHGIVPALAYRITIGKKVIVISGDTNDADGTLGRFAHDADLLVMHHAIPEHGYRGAENLHMTPSQIGKIAARAKAKKVLLTHRMQRTVGKEKSSEKVIRMFYKGEIVFGEDGMKFKL